MPKYLIFILILHMLSALEDITEENENNNKYLDLVESQSQRYKLQFKHLQSNLRIKCVLLATANKYLIAHFFSRHFHSALRE